MTVSSLVCSCEIGGFGVMPRAPSPILSSLSSLEPWFDQPRTRGPRGWVHEPLRTLPWGLEPRGVARELSWWRVRNL
ncbi:hypothetical protein CDL15_Pgr002966 [Punica granatum]|uniref:Uncharacterized protein n=1 Tax=Punica granatum TaxID=22663 RepID=A0A218X0T6_PUNGR|nr:hypothetical protein CDL15_Pgr002966 [Punica granatum]